MIDDDLDCLVVGGGPAGLMAATYLARFRRRVLVVDAGDSRAAWIPKTHNAPGFPDGVGGRDLLGRMRKQAESYGAVVWAGTIHRLQLDGSRFSAVGDDRVISTPTVLLATGIVDALPNLPALAHLIRSGHIRVCPICDGYEVIGRKVTVVGPRDQALQEARFLTTFTTDLTVVATDSENLSVEKENGIKLFQAPLQDMEVAGDDIVLTLADGHRHVVDILYPSLGCSVCSDLAKPLGVKCDNIGALVVDAHQQTTVEGLYAAGDVVAGLNQISVAVGQGAIAATSIHNSLRGAA